MLHRHSKTQKHRKNTQTEWLILAFGSIHFLIQKARASFFKCNSFGRAFPSQRQMQFMTPGYFLPSNACNIYYCQFDIFYLRAFANLPLFWLSLKTFFLTKLSQEEKAVQRDESTTEVAFCRARAFASQFGFLVTSYDWLLYRKVTEEMKRIYIKVVGAHVRKIQQN